MQHKTELRTLLVMQPLQPISLLEDLKTLFPEVLYFPLRPFAPITADDILPSDDELARTDAILSFIIPPNLVSISQVPRLKLFQGLSAGYTHVTSTPFFKSIPKENALIFASASGIHVSTISEHVLSTVMMLFHRLHTIVIRMRNEQKWMRVDAEFGGYIRELKGMTVGIIGYGHIGRETARLAAGFGSTIVALNRNGLPSPEQGYIIAGTGDPSGSLPDTYYSTDDPASSLAFFAACDVVVNTLPDSELTRGFVGEKELRAMKGDAVYVNIGRGTTTDQDALIKALKAVKEKGEEDSSTGTLRIGGASLDVVDPEPLPEGHELFSLENVVLTPHCSGLSRSYFVRAVDLLSQNTKRLREGKGALNAYRGRGEDD